MNNLYIKTTPAFDRKASLITKTALKEFIDHIEKNPEAGKIIAGRGEL